MKYIIFKFNKKGIKIYAVTANVICEKVFNNKKYMTIGPTDQEVVCYTIDIGNIFHDLYDINLHPE